MANLTDPQPVPRAVSEPGDAWYTKTPAQVSAQFGVDPESGLSETEARQRRAEAGPNQLQEQEHESIWESFLEELREPLIVLLLVTGVLYGIWGELSDAITIFAVILIVISVEVFNERRAEQAITALRRLAEPTAPVRREGHLIEVPAENVVPGDVVLLQAGRRVPADGRLMESYGLSADESALTGESLPVEKDADLILPAHTALADRRNLVFAGTTVTGGRGTALVVGTGMATELGRVAGLAREVKAPRTPLQKAMGELSRWLVWVALAFSVLIPLLGWLSGQPLRQMVLTGLSLAFATIPEEAPIIITMVLALGAYRLSKRRAIVKRLQAVETLGAVTVIATDKTGTLTENRMAVSSIVPEDLRGEVLEIGVLCNRAAGNGVTGDPLEVALLNAARDAGMDIDSLRRTYPLRTEFTFDNIRKRMSTVYERDGALWIAVKGAPEAILPRSVSQMVNGATKPMTEADRQVALDMAAQMAANGLRVIAFAEKTAPDDAIAPDAAESGLTFVGLAGLADPPRPEAREAIMAARAAGIRTMMVTGDHPLTAKAIAAQVGLDGSERVLTGPDLDRLSDEALRQAVEQVVVYARTTPEHKLRIVRALHDRGERVAVTGDGINDAPALAAADIGVAMGETGTDVAREAADMVLADDNFTTIVQAVEEGRILFENLKKGVRYYLACKVGLILSTLLPALLGIPVPFAPVQIILMELFMDLGASATFVAEPAESDLMRQPPRNPRTPFMNRAMVSSIFSSGVGLFVAVSIVYLVSWYGGAGQTRAQAVAFVTWLIGHVLLALNLRSEREPLIRLGIFSNHVMNIWAAATIIFVLIATFVPGTQALVKTVRFSGQEWLLVIGVTVLCTFWMELRKIMLGLPGSGQTHGEPG